MDKFIVFKYEPDCRDCKERVIAFAEKLCNKLNLKRVEYIGDEIYRLIPEKGDTVILSVNDDVGGAFLNVL